MTLKVAVAVAFPGRQEVFEIEVAEGSTVADALAIARIAERFPEPMREVVAFGIWSRACDASTPLREGDRVEVYRALQADPKDQRRERARLKPSTRSRSGS